MKNKILILFICIILTSCTAENKADEEVMPFITMDSYSLSVPSVKLFFYAKEKNIISNSVVGTNFWGNIINDNERYNYATYEKEVIFYEQLMNMMALSGLYDEHNELTENELLSVSNNASRFFQELSQKDKDLLQLNREDVENLLITAKKAQKMEKYYIDNWQGSISEEEFRVCLVQKFVFDDEQDATNFAENEFDEDISPTSILSISKDSDINYQQIIDIFRLKNDEKTNVYATQDGYVVYLMLNIYDIELSEQKKQELMNEKQKSSWLQICKKYLETARVEINFEEWSGMNFSSNDEYSMSLNKLFDYL